MLANISYVAAVLVPLLVEKEDKTHQFSTMPLFCELEKANKRPHIESQKSFWEGRKSLSLSDQGSSRNGTNGNSLGKFTTFAKRREKNKHARSKGKGKRMPSRK